MIDEFDLQTALRQSAYDLGREPMDLLKNENLVFASERSEKAKSYYTIPHTALFVYYGKNVAASVEEALVPDIEVLLETLDNKYRLFEPSMIYKVNDILRSVNARIELLAEFFLPDKDALYSASLPINYETKVLEQPDFAQLYLPQWHNALCEDRKELDMLGVGAYDNGKLVALAACSADCEEMWQIGVDVLPEYRRQGIASALTNRLAREIYSRNKVPFYQSAWSNVISVRNAVKSGFRPAWVEMSAMKVEGLE